jgi:hypothetical protein
VPEISSARRPQGQQCAGRYGYDASTNPHYVGTFSGSSEPSSVLGAARDQGVLARHRDCGASIEGTTYSVIACEHVCTDRRFKRGGANRRLNTLRGSFRIYARCFCEEVTPQMTQEERWRGDCNKAANDNSTPIASGIAAGAEAIANLADAAATISVFVPGGQGFAGGAKLTSFAAQGIQGLANLYIGRSTGNYSALRAQGAGFVTGSVFGAGTGRVANAALKGTGTFTRSEAGALGDALGAIYGDAASGAACGQR